MIYQNKVSFLFKTWQITANGLRKINMFSLNIYAFLSLKQDSLSCFRHKLTSFLYKTRLNKSFCSSSKCVLFLKCFFMWKCDKKYQVRKKNTAVQAMSADQNVFLWTNLTSLICIHIQIRSIWVQLPSNICFTIKDNRILTEEDCEMKKPQNSNFITNRYLHMSC